MQKDCVYSPHDFAHDNIKNKNNKNEKKYWKKIVCTFFFSHLDEHFEKEKFIKTFQFGFILCVCWIRSHNYWIPRFILDNNLIFTKYFDKINENTFIVISDPQQC